MVPAETRRRTAEFFQAYHERNEQPDHWRNPSGIGTTRPMMGYHGVLRMMRKAPIAIESAR